MTPSPTTDLVRSELRRRTLWVVAVALLLAGFDFFIFPVRAGAEGRPIGAVAAAIVAALAVTVIGSWILHRPLLQAIGALEDRATDADVERSQAERLASAVRMPAGLAHEVGNPLCAITNYAHSLEEKVVPELRGTVQALQREVSRIERIIAAYTDHVRPRDPGSLGADVNDALRSSLGLLSDQGVLRRIAVLTQLEEAPLPARGDTLALEQVFVNLILNAADAMPGGGRLVIWTQRAPRQALEGGLMRRAGDARTSMPSRRRDERLAQWVSTHDAEDVAMVVMADSGHGVQPGDEERIFEPFVTTKAPDQGSGLGLAVVRRLVDAMRGMVWVQTAREGGAAFHLVFPIFNTDPATAR